MVEFRRNHHFLEHEMIIPYQVTMPTAVRADESLAEAWRNKHGFLPPGEGDSCAFPTKGTEGSLYLESQIESSKVMSVLAPEPPSFDGYPDVDLPDGAHFFIPKLVREDPQSLQQWREDHNVDISELPDELTYPRLILNVDIAMSTGALQRWAHKAKFFSNCPPVGMLYQPPKDMGDDRLKEFFEKHNFDSSEMFSDTEARVPFNVILDAEEWDEWKKKHAFQSFQWEGRLAYCYHEALKGNPWEMFKFRKYHGFTNTQLPSPYEYNVPDDLKRKHSDIMKWRKLHNLESSNAEYVYPTGFHAEESDSEEEFHGGLKMLTTEQRVYFQSQLRKRKTGEHEFNQVIGEAIQADDELDIPLKDGIVLIEELSEKQIHSLLGRIDMMNFAQGCTRSLTADILGNFNFVSDLTPEQRLHLQKQLMQKTTIDHKYNATIAEAIENDPELEIEIHNGTLVVEELTDSEIHNLLVQLKTTTIFEGSEIDSQISESDALAYLDELDMDLGMADAKMSFIADVNQSVFGSPNVEMSSADPFSPGSEPSEDFAHPYAEAEVFHYTENMTDEADVSDINEEMENFQASSVASSLPSPFSMAEIDKAEAKGMTSMNIAETEELLLRSGIDPDFNDDDEGEHSLIDMKSHLEELHEIESIFDDSNDDESA
jgi:hypothetical protein